MLRRFQENREKVALLLQLSDNLVEKGHTHTDNIKSWASLVDRRYNDFSVQMEKYRDKLMSTLGIPLDGSGVSNVMCGERDSQCLVNFSLVRAVVAVFM